MNRQKLKIILASSSPRRIEMLTSLGLPFQKHVPDWEEIRENNEDPIDYALRNSINKGLTVLSELKSSHQLGKEITLIISADTIVLIDGLVLEKPKDKKDAKAMLSRIAGRTHTVVTAMSVIKHNGDEHEVHSKTVTTEVTLAPVSDKEIERYINTEEPMDKAGSYAIQGKGGYMVARIDGSYSNVVGLPLSELFDLIRTKCNVSLPDHFYTQD
jgi:septum formation protein